MTATVVPRAAAPFGWRLLSVLAVPLGLLASAVLVWHTSQSAFSTPTTNGPNSLAAGNVNLTDNDVAAALFSVTGLKPGSTDTRCIGVSYSGSLAAAVRLYVAPGALVDSGLADYLTIKVEEGNFVAFGSACTGFTPTSTLSNGTLTALAAGSTNAGSGLSSWAPTGADSRGYRFTYTLADDNLAQAGSSQVTFTWEARNT